MKQQQQQNKQFFMASFGFSVRVYGEVDQQPPYVGDAKGNLPAVSATYDSDATLVANFPTTPVNIWPIGGSGAVMGGNTTCYGVIEIPASGLQLHSKKFVVQQTVAALASLRNA